MEPREDNLEMTADEVDVREKGKTVGGREIASDRRLFMQLLAYGGCGDAPSLVAALEQANVAAVLYEDINDPQGIALLTFSEDPNFFIDELRHFLNRPPFSDLPAKPEYTMFGRTYSLGYEPDLQQALIERPQQRICNPDYRWAIWYPLRRSGSFEQLSPEEQRVVLQEHGGVGRAFGRAGHGTDIRLACYGLDKNDNDFVIGLVGPDLHPLSLIVQRMRKTRQTSLYLESLGPFFAGRVVWQNKVTKSG